MTSAGQRDLNDDGIDNAFGKGSELALAVLAMRRPPQPQRQPVAREEPKQVATTARQRRLAEALSDAYAGCCDDPAGADMYFERAAELLAELDAMAEEDES